jgi:hypothetical protein
MSFQFQNGNRIAAYIACYLIFRIHFQNNLGWLFHKPICAGRTLVIISFAAARAK